MKISYNWLSQFIDTNLSPQELSLVLTGTGLEVESVEQIQTIAGGLEGLVIGFVKECVQHPNADRLKITKVDVGTGQDLQVVCGANNVAAGQKVIVATVGCTVYPTSGEPFKINKSKIRGEVSEGMICAEDEIGLGTAHDGIMILPDDVNVGTPAKTYFKLDDDYVFEIGLTPNRADAASHLGVARDVAAYLKKEVLKPKIDLFKIDNNTLNIAIEVNDTDACIRYAGVTISGVTVKESPDWLKKRLISIGLKPINNIVDATNFVLHDVGQPLHAFDADEIAGKKIIVKKVANNTPFTTLDGVERKLTDHDLMICDTEKSLCIAGVFGGLTSGISQKTTNVFLESACFNAVSVRKTAKRFGLKTDASFRFERGVDPEITVYALKRAALIIQEIAGGQISSEITDVYPVKIQPSKVSLSWLRLNQLIGQVIPKDEVKEILRGLDVVIEHESDESLQLSIPHYRVDVTRDIDVIEEILRIYGYDRIAIPGKINASLNYVQKPDAEVLQHSVADMLSANGFFEILTNSLTKSSNSRQETEIVKILNPLSSDLDVLRQEMLFTGLESVAYNQNRKNTDLKFYEFGKTYHLKEDQYIEKRHLAIYLSGFNNVDFWNNKDMPTDFYHLKSVVDAILKKLNISNLNIDDAETNLFAYGLKLLKGSKTVVEFGQVNATILQRNGIEKPVFYADFDWDVILKTVRNNKIKYSEVSKYPSVRRDLSLLVNKKVKFNELKQIAEKAERKLLKAVNVFDVYEGNKLAEGKKSYALSFILQDEQQTLTDKQIDQVMQKLIVNLEKEAGAEIRK